MSKVMSFAEGVCISVKPDSAHVAMPNAEQCLDRSLLST